MELLIDAYEFASGLPIFLQVVIGLVLFFVALPLSLAVVMVAVGGVIELVEGLDEESKWYPVQWFFAIIVAPIAVAILVIAIINYPSSF